MKRRWAISTTMKSKPKLHSSKKKLHSLKSRMHNLRTRLDSLKTRTRSLKKQTRNSQTKFRNQKQRRKRSLMLINKLPNQLKTKRRQKKLRTSGATKIQISSGDTTSLKVAINTEFRSWIKTWKFVLIFTIAGAFKSME